MTDVVDAGLPLFVLLNPFMLWVYLQEMLDRLEPDVAVRVLLRGAGTAAGVFVVFAWTGDALFSDVLQVRFASFLLFGGVIFLVIGVRFVIYGEKAKAELAGGKPAHVAGSIAMPFMVGPGTVSASVLAGERVGHWTATVTVVIAVAAATAMVLAIRWLQHRVAARYAEFVERYSALVGRISALVIGTVAVDMILRGIDLYRSRG